MAHCSSSSSNLPVQGLQPSHPSDSAASAAGSHHGAPDDNFSFALTLNEDPWKIKKVLTMNDVDGSCRLLLSTKAVDGHVFSSMSKNDTQLCKTGSDEVRDADESCGNNFSLKKWYNTYYFVLTSKWNRNFVNRKSIKEGDMIGLTWDGAQFCFNLLNRN